MQFTRNPRSCPLSEQRLAAPRTAAVRQLCARWLRFRPLAIPNRGRSTRCEGNSLARLRICPMRMSHPGDRTPKHSLQTESTNEGVEMKKIIATGVLALAMIVPTVASAATPGQSNAVRAAKSYLSLTAFSRKGLVEQLKVGDGYTTAQATYAVNHIRVNYNAQAVKAAKSYLHLTSFSRSGLIEQLEIGDGYTVAQATYG